MAIAVRDYAPGTDTVLDGRVYRSDGVTLNWHMPAEQEGPPEIQSLRWAWRCRACGGNGTRPTLPNSCPYCREPAPQSLTFVEYLQPAGFAVDIRWKPHNDITIPQYIPVRDPLISLEGADWLAMPSPNLGVTVSVGAAPCSTVPMGCMIKATPSVSAVAGPTQ